MTVFSRIDAFLENESTLGPLKRNLKLYSLQRDIGRVNQMLEYLIKIMNLQRLKDSAVALHLQLSQLLGHSDN